MPLLWAQETLDMYRTPHHVSMWTPKCAQGPQPPPQTSHCLRDSLRPFRRQSACFQYFLPVVLDLPCQAAWPENQLLTDHPLNVQ